MTNEQLVIRIKAGIDVAENMLQLWQQNRGLIGKIACKYKGYEDIEDLKQEGYIGLYNAVEGYRPEEGTAFATYAVFWIRQSMQRYIDECGSVVRLPVSLRAKIGRYKKLTAAFLVQFCRNPTEQECCYYLGIGYERLDQLKQAMLMDDMESLDVPIREGEDGSLYDLLPDQEDPECAVVEQMQQEQLRDTLWSMVDNLPGQQPTVIRMRYQEGKTLKEVGSAAGLTIEQARQQQNKAIRELRRSRELQSLRYGDTYSKALKGNGVEHFNRTWTSSTEYAAIEDAEGWSQRTFPEH
ncbi:MAG: sigma-70 family RNA polymerase sigma factor [Eubacteriales bacterium]|nr:sigma-70 family RNA polymerase sigma factor [Eubacteriales bacterium]